MADIPMSAEERKFKEVASEMMTVLQRNEEYVKAVDEKDYLQMTLLFCEAQKDIMGYLMDKVPEGPDGDKIREMLLNAMLEVSQHISVYKELRDAMRKAENLYGKFDS